MRGLRVSQTPLGQGHIQLTCTLAGSDLTELCWAAAAEDKISESCAQMVHPCSCCLFLWRELTQQGNVCCCPLFAVAGFLSASTLWGHPRGFYSTLVRSSCQVLGDLSVCPDLDSEHINGHLNSPIIYRTERFARNYKEWQARDKCSMHSVSICGGKYTDGGLLSTHQTSD